MLCLLTLLACAPEPPPERPGLDVVVILVDALRADRLGPWGGPPSPTVEALAAESAVFARATAPDAWTVPSVASLFSGLYPLSHRALRMHRDGEVALDALAEEHLTLAEVFAGHGYATGALLKTTALPASHGFAQGFADYAVVEGDRASGRSGAELTREALAWVERRGRGDRPFFLYLHYMDPHAPYQAPAPDLDPDLVASSDLDGSHRQLVALNRGERSATPADLAVLRARYDAEVAFVDTHLAPLLGALDPSRTAVALVADHGEQLGEHGGWLHEHLWEENTHVPLVIRAPGVQPGRFETRVSTLDLGPTLLELAGLPVPAQWQGRSLSSSLLSGAEPEARRVYASYGAQGAVWDGRHKLVRDDTGTRLVDLAADAAEGRDLTAERVDEAVRLEAALDAHERGTREAGRALLGAGPRPLDEVQAEQLRALGYLESPRESP